MESKYAKGKGDEKAVNEMIGIAAIIAISFLSGFLTGNAFGRDCLHRTIMDHLNNFNPHERLYVDYLKTIINNMR